MFIQTDENCNDVQRIALPLITPSMRKGGGTWGQNLNTSPSTVLSSVMQDGLNCPLLAAAGDEPETILTFRTLRKMVRGGRYKNATYDECLARQLADLQSWANKLNDRVGGGEEESGSEQDEQENDEETDRDNGPFAKGDEVDEPIEIASGSESSSYSGID